MENNFLANQAGDDQNTTQRLALLPETTVKDLKATTDVSEFISSLFSIDTKPGRSGQI